jgi:ATP-dependent Clp protease adaptor protein ClpS
VFYRFFGSAPLEKPTAIVKYTTYERLKRAKGMATKQENAALLEKEKIKPPRLYKVLLLNDDYTTMDFVVEVLQTIFGMDFERANQVMLKVHQEGSAVCGIYTRDLAETKVAQVMALARQHEHPLQCITQES